MMMIVLAIAVQRLVDDIALAILSEIETAAKISINEILLPTYYDNTNKKGLLFIFYLARSNYRISDFKYLFILTNINSRILWYFC